MSCKLTELCEGDKQKVAKLLKKVVDLSGQLKAAEDERGKAERKFSAKELMLRRRSKKAAAENARLQAELTKTMKLLRTYNNQLMVRGAEAESAEPSACPHSSQLPRPGSSHPARRTDARLCRDFEDQEWKAQVKKAQAEIAAIEADCLQQLFQLQDQLSDVQPERSSRQGRSRVGDDDLAEDCLLEFAFELPNSQLEIMAQFARPQSGSASSHRTGNHHRLEEWSAEDADELLSVIYETESEAA